MESSIIAIMQFAAAITLRHNECRSTHVFPIRRTVSAAHPLLITLCKVQSQTVDPRHQFDIDSISSTRDLIRCQPADDGARISHK
jgi:hypothetical protein